MQSWTIAPQSLLSGEDFLTTPLRDRRVLTTQRLMKPSASSRRGHWSAPFVWRLCRRRCRHRGLLKLVAKGSYLPFVWYRIVVGVALLIASAAGWLSSV